VMPGHSETLTSAGELVFDVAGVKVVGLGWGNTRPTFLLDSATTTDVDVEANDVWLENLRFGAGHADVVECIDLSGARLTLKNCEFYDNAADENFVDYIKITGDNDADGLTVIDCVAVSPDTGNDGFINAGGDVDKLTFQRNFIRLGLQNNEPIIEVVGKSLTNCLITHNFFYRLNTDTSSGALLNSDQTDNSGIVAYNTFAHRDTGSEVPIDLTGADAFENYATGVADASGYLLPAADS